MTAGSDAYSLVLGAGGRPGLAYHAGTLLALDLHGIRPSDARTLTGTSIGSVVTALLVRGATAEDIAAYVTDASPRAEFADVAAAIRAAESGRMRLDPRALWHVADVRRAVTALDRVRAGRLAAALAALLPGLIEITHRFAFLDALESAAFGNRSWRIVAADARGRRHVLSNGDAALSLAVAASCAIPAVFAAVTHDGRRLVDGGVHSTTNADLATADDAGTVIVLAPMCPGVGEPGTGGNVAARSLDGEIARLEAAGKRVVTFRPSAQLRRLMGWNPLSAKRARQITGAAFLEAASVLDDAASLLAMRRPAGRSA